jgi:hypothetical protein
MAYHRLKGDPIVEPDMQTHKKGAGETRGMVSQAPAD